jgi:hypothetical protein
MRNTLRASLHSDGTLSRVAGLAARIAATIAVQCHSKSEHFWKKSQPFQFSSKKTEVKPRRCIASSSCGTVSIFVLPEMIAVPPSAANLSIQGTSLPCTKSSSVGDGA